MGKIYKIRHSSTGLYSMGGTDADRWNKHGKTWPSIGALKNHLRLYQTGGRYMNRPIPPEWEVIPIEVSYSPQTAVMAAQLLT